MSNELPTHATGVLQQFSTSRAGIDIFSDQVIEAVQQGEVSALQVRVWIKSMEEIIERVKKETNQNQLTEAEKYAELTFNFAGAKIEKADFGKWDFSVCQDMEWEIYDAQEKHFADKRRDRELFLRAIQKPTAIITDDGEAKTIYPPIKKSNPGLKVSIR